MSRDHNTGGKQNEFQILPDGLLLKINNIHLNHFLKAYPAASVDLPRACQPRLSREAKPFTCCVGCNFVGHGWAWTNQGHLTTQDIEKLRQFINAGLANKSTNSGNMRIITQLIERIAAGLAIYSFRDGYLFLYRTVPP